MARLSTFIRNQIGREEAICLQELGILGEVLQQLCSRWAPSRSWSMDVGIDNRVGAFLMLGKGWMVFEDGSKGDGTFMWFGVESIVGPFFISSINAPSSNQD